MQQPKILHKAHLETPALLFVGPSLLSTAPAGPLQAQHTPTSLGRFLDVQASLCTPTCSKVLGTPIAGLSICWGTAPHVAFLRTLNQGLNEAPRPVEGRSMSEAGN